MRFKGVLVALIATPLMVGCYTSRTITTPQPYLAGVHPAEITVVDHSGSETVVFGAKVTDGSITGLSDSDPSCALERCRAHDLSFKLSDVQSIKVRQMDKGKTFGLAAIGVVIVAGGIIAAGSGGGQSGDCINCQTMITSPHAPQIGVSLSKLIRLGTLLGAH